MSRIDKALEKAAQMRASTAGAAVSVAAEPEAGPIFEIGEPAVDPSLVDRHIVCVTDPKSLAAEQYRKLRARIVTTTRKDHLNTLMVTSAESGEGKTVTAINLAVSIAHQIDHTVLLVDADLRKPSVHHYLGIKPKLGLSDYLRNQAELPDVLVKTGIGKLVLLPAGNLADNPSELMESARMRDLVKEMKHRYSDRYIIFDSAPILLAADALSLGTYMDGIIFVVQAAHTSPKAASTALSLFKGCNILGCIFNNVPAYLGQSVDPYYHRYQYGYPTGHSGSNNGNGGGPGLKTGS
jgi:protein-tyrosine kinase